VDEVSFNLFVRTRNILEVPFAAMPVAGSQGTDVLPGPVGTGVWCCSGVVAAIQGQCIIYSCMLRDLCRLVSGHRSNVVSV
jgi:hypothetical protein